MCGEEVINLFMETFSNLKTVSWKSANKQKDESGRINFIFFVIIMKESSLLYYYFTIAMMTSVVSCGK